MAITSDIPDFAAGQLGLPNDLLHPHPTSKVDFLRESSPSSQVEQVTCPTLILLGTHDLRVPCSQGISWYRWLQAKGVDSRLYLFPDAQHALDTPEGDRWSEVLAMAWFIDHK